MNTFEKTVQLYQKQLELYVPVVTRVHGTTHPEFHEVKTVFDTLNDKIKTRELSTLNLDVEFQELRAITNNYQVPHDVCESYEAVYQMLEAMDKAYHQ